MENLRAGIGNRVCRVLLVAVLVAFGAALGSCGSGSSSAPSSSSNPYAGRWIGQFRWVHNNGSGDVVESMNVTIILEEISPPVGGVTVLSVEAFGTSDPRFGLPVGLFVPDQGLSIATLPYPPENVSSQDGLGISIFINGHSLQTWNEAGSLHMSSGAFPVTMSHVLGSRQPTWISDIFDTVPGGFNAVHTATWSLTQSSL